MTDLQANTLLLNELILKGDTLKAMELFYADNVSMQENEEAPRFGKQTCLDNEKHNLQNVKGISSKLLHQAINNETNIVFSEWQIIFTSNSDKKMKLTEVSVQQWDKGKIIHEKFYYKDFYPAG